jgi:putative tricarboxylic transport membrane protein
VLKTQRSGNIACGAFLALLGIAAAWAATYIDEGAGGHLHPRNFPLLLGVLLSIGGAGLAVHALVAKAGADKAIGWPDRRGWKLWGIALLALVLYVGLSHPLGFLICTFFFVAGFIWYFGRYKPMVAVAWAMGVAAFVYVVFIWLLDLTLPMGPLALLS